MKVVIHNLYHIEGEKSYYRKLGMCFDFVNSADLATDLTDEECQRIAKSAEWYCDKYGAERLTIED